LSHVWSSLWHGVSAFICFFGFKPEPHGDDRGNNLTCSWFSALSRVEIGRWILWRLHEENSRRARIWRRTTMSDYHLSDPYAFHPFTFVHIRGQLAQPGNPLAYWSSNTCDLLKYIRTRLGRRIEYLLRRGRKQLDRIRPESVGGVKNVESSR